MEESQTRYVFVTGGVLSGIGKGITAASLGAVFKARGLKVSMQKCDPYLNVDAGTLNPAEHGECFVTKDGAETDLDLGHYERFLDEEMTQQSATLAGRIFRDLIAEERAGKFLGKTVQLVPHVTAAIQQAIEQAAKDSDIHIVEIGGTVGDYEGLAFLEAIREMAVRLGRERCQFMHVVYVPYLETSKEFKTKPAQNALRDLRQFGIIPDAIAVRTVKPAPSSIIKKLSLFGGVAEAAVGVLPNAETVYQVPLTLAERGLDELLLRSLGLKAPAAKMQAWQELVERATATAKDEVHIGIVAKYLANEDTYFSVVEALKAAAWAEGVKLRYEWVNAETVEKKGPAMLKQYDGLLTPGGFGVRGLEGKVAAADFALRGDMPYLGICLGLQMAVIAAARRGGVKTATTAEINPEAEYKAIYIMADQVGKEATGGTMRLGDYPCRLAENSLARELFEAEEITERHRHRYEVNRQYESAMTKGGIVISGQSPDGALVEMVEAVDHPYFIATQAHPEFRSRPFRPHPLFSGFLRAARKRRHM